MADIIKKATNKFTKGLVMDFSPENTGNEVLTNALNATLLTFNGNELSLQNDMGNARVETAFLPEGYIPVGSCEYGGIIYIVSYNPLEDKSQIGCFPSPERNISSDELGMATQTLTSENFVDKLGDITHNTKAVLLKEDKLNPGDKFIISATESIYQNALKDLLQKDSDGVYKQKDNPIIALNIVSIEDSGKIVYLNSDVRQYENGDYSYYILGKKQQGSNLQPTDIDSYRNVVCSGYNVFKSKTSGKLAILAELIMIDSYSVTHSIKQNPLRDNQFDIYIHTEIEPQLTNDNYASCPKLKYYYLQKSQGQLQIYDKDKNPSMISLFREENGVPTAQINQEFLDTNISSIYNDYSQDLQQPLNLTGKFHFPKSGYYHGNMQPTNTKGEDTYTKFYAEKYHRISKSQIIENNNTELLTDYYLSELRANFYKYQQVEKYTKVPDNATLDDNKDYYVETTETVYNDVKRNPEYQDERVLYKLVTEPYVATKKEIEDSTIEKYLAITKDLYLPATSEQIENWEREELWIAVDNGYEKNTEQPISGKNYYIKSTVTEWRSIGSSVDEDNYTGVIYYFAQSKDYSEATEEDLEKYWDTTTYPIAPLILYYKTQSSSYVLATEEQKLNYKTYNIVLYYKEEYILVNDALKNGTYTDNQGQLFIVVPTDTYVSYETFKPDENYNYIEGYTTPANTFPKDDPITLHKVADFIPESDVLEYEDVKLANITIPRIIHDNKYSFPFKYDYTIVPCMNYGKLAHLTVSNTIDFSKLYSFSQSDFNVWKYHIDENQLRLTFGAEIYDTIEENKVDALILEFYDLRGFAGSLEICDKKSYSGVFTKLLSLNTVNTLSNKKVHNNNYITTFKRNAAIIQKDDSKYYLNNKEVYYSGAEEGWRYASDSTSLSDLENDCGTLYSNILYGVRTYLRVTDNDGYNFIPKTQFFLYTLPIYNKYYYACDNFNELEYPKLDLMLTYKLQDDSSIFPYNSDVTNNGYIKSQENSDVADVQENIQKYLSGTLEESSLKTTRYYMCKGTTDLYLEVGLKKEYNDFNLQYDIDLRKYFSCNIQLVGNEPGKTFALKSNNSDNSEENILNYQGLFDTSVNRIGFDQQFNGVKSLEPVEFQNMQFLYYPGVDPTKINYEFVIGYNVNIDDIKATDIKTTTVSALCHSTDNGYNYEDFGVYYVEDLPLYDRTDDQGNIVDDEDRHYKSDQLFYSTGDAENLDYGICRQVKTDGTIVEQFRKICQFSESAQKYSSEGLLYSGTPLKQVMPYIGKLAFCLPHVHGLSEENGVSITYSKNGDDMVIHPYFTENEEDRYLKKPMFSRGCAPGVSKVVDKSENIVGIGSKPMYDSPQCSMLLLSKQSVLYNSEFISTIQLSSNKLSEVTKKAYAMYSYNKEDSNLTDCSWTEKTGFIFKGLQGYLLCKYNRRLINTMKKVYGYNKDFDTYTYNVGNVSVPNNDVTFTSQLLSTNAKLDLDKYGKNFNDFIYFGGVNVSIYLKHLYDFSDKKIAITEMIDGDLCIKPQIQFEPSFTYCGSENQGFLITSLNYNVPTPKSLSEELSFEAVDRTVVRHADGTVDFIKGKPSKNALYGWDSSEKKMIQLDVSNYTIEDDGDLSLKSNLITYTKTVNFVGYDLSKAGANNTFTCKLGYDINAEDITTSLVFDTSDQHRLDGVSFYILVPSSKRGCTIPVRTILTKPKTNGYDVKLESITVNDCQCYMLQDSVHLSELSQRKLSALMSANPIISSSYSQDSNTQFSVNAQTNEEEGWLLFKITISQVSIMYNMDPTVLTSDFMNVTPTKSYSEFVDLMDGDTSMGKYVYKIKDAYEDSVIKYTTVTLNDLVYDGVSDQHKLFIKDSCYQQYSNDDYLSQDNTPVLTVYYRPYKHDNTEIQKGFMNSQWEYEKYKDYNALHLHLGPSFYKEL